MIALLGPLPVPGWRRYAIALAAVAGSTLLRMAIEPWVGERLPFVTLFFSSFVAAWYGGLGPGLLATALGACVSTLIFLGALGRVPGMDRVAVVGTFLYVLTGIATAWMGETRLRAIRLADQAARKAGAEADRADEERDRAEDEAAKAEEAAAEAEIAAQDAADALNRQLEAETAVRSLQRLESVGRLAGGMAHEVNNQMTVVLGATDFILRRTDLPTPVRTDVQFIRDAATRSAGITAQLLAFGRRQVLRPEVVDLNAIVASFDPVLRRTIGDHYRVAMSLAPEGGRVRVDRGQLEQVLLNLALNAADAMPDGGRLTLRTEATTLVAGDRRLPLEPDVRPGPYMALMVQDSGTGMDSATLDRIFEPFFTTKAVGKGTGLGLSTVYGIVRQSGGYVAAASTLGAGATFTIYLPVTDAPEPAVSAAAPAVDGGRGELVLVVEDKPEVRQMAARALVAGGFGVVEAADGVEAMALMSDGLRGVRLVLADLALPNKNGLELARELEQRQPDLPVLFMTGYTSDESARRLALLRGHPLIEKPFTADQLVRRVREALEDPTPRA